MRLAVNLGYWGAGNDADNLALAREAERLGYAVVWAAEAYGSDAATVLAWVAAQTERIDIGSAVFQIPARSPAMTAMTAATLDTLSGGRFRLGLGVSGPQVSEGWHGVRFDKPLGRTREYVEIVRRALRASVSRTRESTGRFRYRMVRARRFDSACIRSGTPSRSISPRSVREIWSSPAKSPMAGWRSSTRPSMPTSCSTRSSGTRVDRTPDLIGSTWCLVCPWSSATTSKACASRCAYAALYVGRMEQGRTSTTGWPCGWGTRGCRTRAGAVSARQHRGAAAAVPFEFLDRTSLLGPRCRASPSACTRTPIRA